MTVVQSKGEPAAPDNAPCCGLWAAATKARDAWKARALKAEAELAEIRESK